MRECLDIFSSKAKIKILRTLYYQCDPIPLRQIAYISGLAVFSVQHALKQLEKDHLILKRKKHKHTVYEINRKSAYYNFLNNLFLIEMKHTISTKAPGYDKKAHKTLLLSNQLLTFSKRSKERMYEYPSLL